MAACALDGSPHRCVVRGSARFLLFGRIFGSFDLTGPRSRLPMSRAVFVGLLLIASFVVRAAEPAGTIMTLSRSACFGTCPDYRVEIHGNGEVTYQGNGFVLIPGTHHWHIDPEAVAKLLELFQRADYFNLKDRYEINASDLATFETSLTVGGRRKSILDYGGSGMLGNAFASTSSGGEDPHMPPIVTEIENAMDEAAGT